MKRLTFLCILLAVSLLHNVGSVSELSNDAGERSFLQRKKRDITLCLIHPCTHEEVKKRVGNNETLIIEFMKDFNCRHHVKPCRKGRVCQALNDDTATNTRLKVACVGPVTLLKMVDKSNTLVQVGDRVQIRCDSDSGKGDDPDTITWWKNGAPLRPDIKETRTFGPGGGIIHSSLLTFIATKEDDKARIKCMFGRHEKDNFWKETILHIFEKTPTTTTPTTTDKNAAPFAKKEGENIVISIPVAALAGGIPGGLFFIVAVIAGIFVGIKKCRDSEY